MTSDNEPWAIEAINYYLSVFAVMATEEQYKERVNICKGCKFFGVVEIPGAVVDGCTICGCPVATKPRVVKYFNPAKLRIVKAECPMELWPEL